MLVTGATLITPTLGVAAATTINKVTITAPATGSTLTIADGKTLTVPNTVILGTTLTDGDICTYTAAGTVINCNTSPSGTGTVTSIATTGPITGGTITTTGTIACATCVVASSPAAGIAHFAGSTQTVTSSLIATADIAANAVTLAKLATQGANTVLANVTAGSAVPTAATIPAGVQFYTSGTGYSAATSANLLGVCTTCVTSAASLTSNALMTGAGGQASQTVTTGTGVLTALGVATGSAGAFSVLIASGTATLGTSAIASGACATTVTATATGGATTDVIQADFNASPIAITGYGASATGAVLTIYKWVTSNTANFSVCNSTANSITPGAATLNWRINR